MRRLWVVLPLVFACQSKSGAPASDMAMAMTLGDMAMPSSQPDLAGSDLGPDLAPAPATRLVFASPSPSPTCPSDTILGFAIDVVDDAGNRVALANTLITLTLQAANGAQLMGNMAGTTDATGELRLDRSYIDRPGTGYQLTASANLLASASATFDCVAAWQPVPSPTPSPIPGQYWSALVAPDNSNVVYLAADVGLFKTSNGGTSWQLQKPGGVDASYAPQVIADPSNRIYVYASGSYYRQASGDSVWTKLGWPGTRLSFSGSDIYSWTSMSTSNWSSNDGSTWTPIDTSALGLPTDAPQLLVDPTTSGANAILYLSGTHSVVPISSGLFASTNRGQNWASVSPCANKLMQIGVGFDGALFAMCGLKVYRSADHGTTWAPSSFNAPLKYDIATIAMAPSDHSLVYGWTDGGGMFRSADGGRSFVEAGFASNSSVTYNTFAIDAANGNVVWAAIAGLGILRTTTGGL